MSRDEYIEHLRARLKAAEEIIHKTTQQDSVGWQFLSDGEWQQGSLFNNHRRNTEEEGYPVRDVYAGPVLNTVEVAPAVKPPIEDAEIGLRAKLDASKFCVDVADDLRAELAAIKEQKPVSEVSEETFSSDGTSDIITHNLPIGTKLYAAPVATQVVMPVQQVSVPDCFESYRLADKFCEQRLVTDDHVRAIVVDAFASGYGFGIAASTTPGDSQ